MRVLGQLMTRLPVVVEVGTPISACAERMSATGLRHLPVVDTDGALVGLLTDQDVYRRGAAMGADHWVAFDHADQWVLAREVARPVEVVAAPDDPLEGVLRAMVRAFQDVVVAVDARSRPVGVLTEHDAVKAACDLLHERAWSSELPARPVHSVEHDAPVQEVRAWMEDHSARHVVVTREDRLHGVVSYRDLLHDLVPGARSRVGDRVRRVPPEYVVGAVSLLYAARIMHTQGIGCLPVVDPDLRPLCLITREDVTAAVLEELTPVGILGLASSA